MAANTSESDTASPVTQSGPPVWFRTWWQSYRRDITMTAPSQPFVGKWWRDLPLSMRRFIAIESGLHDADRAVSGEFETLPQQDQERILCCSRDILRDLKPITWL